MSKISEKVLSTNSDDKKRYEELYSLQSNAAQVSLNIKNKFRNLITTEECYILVVLAVIILYVVAFRTGWDMASIVVVVLMIVFEILAGVLLFKSLKDAKVLKSKLAGKVDEVFLTKVKLKVSHKDSGEEDEIDIEDIKGIYVTKYNIVILARPSSNKKTIFLDKSCFSDLNAEIEKCELSELVHFIK